MCNCIYDMKKRLEEKGYEHVQPPVEILSGRVYIFHCQRAGEEERKGSSHPTFKMPDLWNEIRERIRPTRHN